eukprot:1162101-Pelagomonas_calceolata.AAC.2
MRQLKRHESNLMRFSMRLLLRQWMHLAVWKLSEISDALLCLIRQWNHPFSKDPASLWLSYLPNRAHIQAIVCGLRRTGVARNKFGFLTAVLQTKARKSQVPIDTLSFEFTIINLDEAEITAPPREGVYVKGLFLENVPTCKHERTFACARTQHTNTHTHTHTHAHTHAHMRAQGGGWDFEAGCLTEPEPMELIVPMPIILFK